MGFVGLGVMGRPMSENMARSFTVAGYDIRQAQRVGLVGVSPAGSVEEVGETCPVVCLSLPSAPSSRR